MRGYYEMPDETAAVVVRRLATHRRPRDRQRRRHVHVRRSQEGGDPAPGREPLTRRGRGGARAPPRRRGSGGDRRAVRAVGGRREGVRRAGAGAGDRRRRRARVRERAPRARSRCRATTRWWPTCPHTPTGRLAKHRLDSERTPARWTSSPRADNLRLTPDDEWLHTWIGSSTRIASRSRAATSPPTSWVGSRSPNSPTCSSRGGSRRRGSAGCSTRCSCRSPTTGSRPARSRPGSTLHGSARVDPGRRRGGTARRGQRVPRPRRATPRSSSRLRSPARRRPIPTTPRSATSRRRRCGTGAMRARACPASGHPVHKDEDPRTPRLYELAAPSTACSARTCDCSRFVADVQADQSGRRLPINGAGRGRCRARRRSASRRRACAASCSIARTAGLVAPPRRRGRANRSACRCGSKSRTAPARATDATLEVSLPVFSR